MSHDEERILEVAEKARQIGLRLSSIQTARNAADRADDAEEKARQQVEDGLRELPDLIKDFNAEVSALDL